MKNDEYELLRGPFPERRRLKTESGSFAGLGPYPTRPPSDSGCTRSASTTS